MAFAILNNYTEFEKNMHKVAANLPTIGGGIKMQQQWNPYTNEGGTVAVISGKDFVVAASNTRMTSFKTNILSRKADNIHVLNDSLLYCGCGFQGDVLQLRRVLDYRIHKFRFDYNRDMTADIGAEMFSRTLYYKRGFPYYTSSIICGIDEHGMGTVYSYDPIGCAERLQHCVVGAAYSLIQPFLDKHLEADLALPVGASTGYKMSELSVERAVSLLKDAFQFAAERETSTGDGIDLAVVQAGKKVVRTRIALRED